MHSCRIRKSGKGFYEYDTNALPEEAVVEAQARCPKRVSLVGEDLFVSAVRKRCNKATIAMESFEDGEAVVKAGTAILTLTDGRTANQRAIDTGIANTVVVDLAFDFLTTKTVAVARAAACSDEAYSDALGLLQAIGCTVIRLRDLPALAVMRTVAMLVNEAADA